MNMCSEHFYTIYVNSKRFGSRKTTAKISVRRENRKKKINFIDQVIQRFSSIHVDLTDQMQSMPCLVEQKLKGIMFYEPFISRLNSHSLLMTPSHPIETCCYTFAEKENLVRPTILKPWWKHVDSIINATTTTSEWAISYINGIITLNATPSSGFFRSCPLS